MRNLRHVELTQHSLIVDGRDISNMATGARVEVRAGAHPEVWITAVPDEILFAADAITHGVPLDGIERLRAYVRELTVSEEKPAPGSRGASPP